MLGYLLSNMHLLFCKYETLLYYANSIRLAYVETTDVDTFPNKLGRIILTKQVLATQKPKENNKDPVDKTSQF